MIDPINVVAIGILLFFIFSVVIFILPFVWLSRIKKKGGGLR